MVPHVGFNIGGGLSIPFSDAGDRFQTGGSFQLGGTYYFMGRLGLQAEYLYSGYGIKSNLLDISGVQGNHVMQYGDLNVIYKIVQPRPFGIYVVGGPGIYYRRVQITEVLGTTVAPYCDPWLFYCYGAPVTVTDVLGSRSRTDFGLNAGLGVSLQLAGGPMSLYAEARYHYIFSGDIDTPDGPKKATGQYLPIVFGFRL
ncbi:MAG: outer membrane beta-barrel protein [Hyalangium sp.]|uniref:outer membrane beta-barrel protein n=1 Tax=Hyalangium sp. TaxID=2028555 RepID=UPI00389A7C4C